MQFYSYLFFQALKPVPIIWLYRFFLLSLLNSSFFWLTYLPLLVLTLKETYGDGSSDSSDEDYGEAASPKRRKNITGKAIQLSSNEPQRMNNGADVNDEMRNQTECDSAPKEKIHRNVEVGNSNNMFAESPRISTEVGSSGKSTGRSYKRLGEGVIQVFMCFLMLNPHLIKV